MKIPPPDPLRVLFTGLRHTGLSPSSGLLSSNDLGGTRNERDGSTETQHPSTAGKGPRGYALGSSRFSRPYSGNPGWFLFLRLLICLNLAGVLPTDEVRDGRRLAPECRPRPKERRELGFSHFKFRPASQRERESEKGRERESGGADQGEADATHGTPSARAPILSPHRHRRLPAAREQDATAIAGRNDPLPWRRPSSPCDGLQRHRPSSLPISKGGGGATDRLTRPFTINFCSPSSLAPNSPAKRASSPSPLSKEKETMRQ